MVLSESERVWVCKDHPYHDQKLGVCPSCLREKLSQLYDVASNYTAKVGPSYLSSASSSVHVSPVHRHHRRLHQRNDSDFMGSISFRVNLGNGLKKSRSLAFVSRNLAGDKHGNKKKKGFWSKFLHLKEKKEVNLDKNIALNTGRFV